MGIIKYTNRDLQDDISSALLTPRAESKRLLDAITTALVNLLKRNGKVTIPGFGRFYVYETKGYMGKTLFGKRRDKWIPPKDIVIFDACDGLRRDINEKES